MSATSSQPLSVELSGYAANFIRAQIATGRHGSASEVIEDLIGQMGDDLTPDKLEAELVAGLNSGSPIPVNAEFWELKRRSLAEWHQRRSHSK